MAKQAAGSECLKQHKNGVTLELLLAPRSAKQGIRGLQAGRLKLAVNAPPVDGAANKAMLEFLSKFLKVPKSALEILKGETSKQKTVLLRGLSLEQIDLSGLDQSK